MNTKNVMNNDNWLPVTKLGRLVKQKKIKSIEEIFYFSIPIKEHQIIDFLIKNLSDDVLKVMPVQKQTRAGQRTKFKAIVAVGNYDGILGLGVKSSKEAGNAIKGAIITAKMAVVPAKKGHWNIDKGIPYTIPVKVTGKSGSVRLRCIPAPKGSGIVAGKIPKKLLSMAGYKDIFTSSRGHTRTIGNFAKATYNAVYLSYCFNAPEYWIKHRLIKNPLADVE
ncbi:40S ribosomal protein S2 (nucleomorph) [Guillardia theta]|uniref:Small ribosomal subunit protein uS5 n=1 Tax=Guillardia theta TaxID=55529 RepID=Q98S71_GUITH|nr:40S ribosomal protein S2 [Guillardia theta]AAK39711.1 40S ribosomal protein S2 [Guillardia theta]|mmetsp:Transcript_39211/g.123682  ORF Transcript_39211/g.123682 Transcript_39211/m.123682 type:complete len:222 (+) Transcript_39211:3490-4155(+)